MSASSGFLGAVARFWQVVLRVHRNTPQVPPLTDNWNSYSDHTRQTMLLLRY